MRRYLFAVLAALLVGAFVFPTAAFAGKPAKVDACHFEEDEQEDEGGTWELQLVSEKALPSLLEADDGEWGVPGGEVPGTDGDYVFDENCVPELAVVDTDGDGVLDDVDNCPTVANLDQLDRYGSTDGDACEDFDGDGTPDVDELNICVSVNGDPVVGPSGTATCRSTPTTGSEANIAVSHGGNAVAVNGNNNTATVTGGGTASANGTRNLGSNNTATATGGGTAILRNANNSTATADGAGSNATIDSSASNSTATATGAGSEALVRGGDNNTAIATAGGDAEVSGGGSNNTATNCTISFGDSNMTCSNP